MEPSQKFNQMMEKMGYSKDAIKKMWKWYDYSEKKGIASY